MRFCPFCAKENADEADHCAHCAKRLPRSRPPAPKGKKAAARAAPPDADGAPEPVAKRPAPAKTLYGVGDMKSTPTTTRPGPLEPKPSPSKGAPSPPSKLAGLDLSDKTAPNPRVEPSEKRPSGTAPTMLAKAGAAVPEKGNPSDHALTVPTALLDPDEVGHPVSAAPTSDTSPTPLVDPPSLPPKVVLDQSEPSVSGMSVSLSQLVSVENAQPIGERAQRARWAPAGFAEDAPDPIDIAALPPMPATPATPSIVGAVRYLYPVARAWWARRVAQKKVQNALVGDQQQLDQVLGELGRAAREEQLETPALREEMSHLAQTEERRGKAAAGTVAAEAERTAAAERFADLEAKGQEAIAEQDEVVRKADEALRADVERRRTEQLELTRLDGEIRTFERRAAALEARASKLPPADPNRAGAELEAGSVRERAAELVPERDAAQAKVTALDGPIGELTQALADARVEQANRKRALATTVAERVQTFQTLEATLARLATEQQTAAGEISRRFVTIGTLLNLNRVERSRFSPLYARIDDLKGGLTEREALIARLEDERSAFDHGAIQKGLIAVGAAIGGLVITAVVLILLLGGGSHRCATASDCRVEELCVCDKEGCVDEKTFAARGRCLTRSEAEKLFRR